MELRDQALFVIQAIYGVSFLVMAGFLFLQWERTAKLGVAGRFILLALFAFTHGASDMAAAALRLPHVDEGATSLAAIRLLLLIVSFLFLLQFGLSLLVDDRQLYRGILGFGALAVLALISGLVVVYASSPEAVRAVERLSRQLIGVPGAMLAALGLMRISARCGRLKLKGCSRDSLWAAGAMAVYGFLAGGILYSPGPVRPGTTLRPNVFEILGLPIQFYRMLAAVTLLIACLRFLSRFDVRVEGQVARMPAEQKSLP